MPVEAHGFAPRLERRGQLLEHTGQMVTVAVEHGQRDLMVGAAGVVNAPRVATHDRAEGLLEGEAAVAGGVDERSVDVPEHQEHPMSLPDCA